MSVMPSPDKNEPSKITGSCVVGGNYTRHEQREFTCSAVQYGRQKYGLFCKTRPPVSFVMSKFQKQNLVKVPFHFVSQQKTRSSAVVFDVALAARPIRNNTFEVNWYIALLPNSVGSTAETSLAWHAILWMHSICSSLRALWTKFSREAFKADKNLLSSLASSDVIMEFISSRDFFDRKLHCHTGSQLMA